MMQINQLESSVRLQMNGGRARIIGCLQAHFFYFFSPRVLPRFALTQRSSACCVGYNASCYITTPIFLKTMNEEMTKETCGKLLQLSIWQFFSFPHYRLHCLVSTKTAVLRISVVCTLIIILLQSCRSHFPPIFYIFQQLQKQSHLLLIRFYRSLLKKVIALQFWKPYILFKFSRFIEQLLRLTW